MQAGAPARAGHSLRTHLLLWLVPPVVGIIIISSIASYTLALRFATAAYDAGLFDAARSLAQQIRFTPSGAAELSLPRAATEILVSDPYDHIYYRVVSASGTTVAGSDDVPLPPAPITRAEPVRFYDASVAGEPVRVGAYALFGETDRSTATVLFAETLVKRNRLSRNLLFTMLLPLVSLALVVVAGVGLAVRRALAPLQRLAADVSGRSWNNLSGVGNAAVPEEVRPLTDAFDGLMRRLGAALTAQQRFISEAAHQLRTPMAGLTSQTERALLANDINTVKPALAQLLVSARRVTRLVNQLLTLARAEPGSGAEREFVPVDLCALVQQTCMEWVPEALQKGVDLGYAGPAKPVLIEGDELLLAEMINNLIDNALRYGASAGGTITVRLTDGTAVELAVEDDGPGIPEAERGRVFERFHRVSGSAPGGCGLGLAIVSEIARAHHAHVSAEVPEGGRGTAVRVRFSEAPTPAPSPANLSPTPSAGIVSSSR
jgi:two-component system sensor histidine kinase TctE